MKNVSRVVILALIVVLVAAFSAPVTAQEAGILIEPTFGSGPNTLNPLFCNDSTCAKLVGLMFPLLVPIDAETQFFAKNARNGLARDWTVSDDGKVYTFKLRDDMKWSDGVPITSKDVVFGFNVITNPDAASPLASGVTTIKSVEAPDDYTVVVTFTGPDCTALATAAVVPVAPAHVLEKDDVKALKDGSFSTAPTVTAGIFKFGEFRASEQTTLIPNPDYIDLLDKAVRPGGFIMPVVPDQTVLVQQFLAGEVNLIDAPAVARRAELRDDAKKGNSQVFDFPGNAWDYIALNQADPTNPRPGLDKDGNIVDQGRHPLFGDVKVRQALAKAIDVEAIIKGAVFGEGTRMAAGIIPTSWAINKDLKPIGYDPEAAEKLLDEAGFPVGPDGIRVAKGAKYAADGTRFAFLLLTNQGNTRREAIGTIVKDQLAQIGIEVDFQAIDFDVLNERVRAQTFDARIGGWLNSFPDDPDQTALFLPESDIPNAGNNFVSYNNPKVTELMRQALNVPGCALEERAKYYREIQQIMAEDVPYIWLYVINGWYGARADVNGFSPQPNVLYDRIETWTVEAK
jgi:peptide/nickel transport system substrate-binding protein